MSAKRKEMVSMLKYKAENIKARFSPEFFLEVMEELERLPDIDLRDKDLASSIKINGEQKKKIICMEEPAELIQAVSKDIRGKLDRDNMIEEMADVMICLEMLKIMHQVKDEELQKWIDYKIDRQMERDKAVIRGWKQ